MSLFTYANDEKWFGCISYPCACIIGMVRMYLLLSAFDCTIASTRVAETGSVFAETELLKLNHFAETEMLKLKAHMNC
jgi:hypothetical protein